MKKLFYLLVAALTFAATSCSNYEETTAVPFNSETTPKSTYLSSQQYEVVKSSMKNVLDSVAHNAWDGQTIDYEKFRLTLVANTSITNEESLALVAEGHQMTTASGYSRIPLSIRNAIEDLKAYFEGKNGVSDEDVAYVENVICANLSETDKENVMIGVLTAKAAGESTNEIFGHGQTRAGITHEEQFEPINIDPGDLPFSVRTFCCNLACGVGGAFTGTIVKGVLVAAGVTGGTGAVVFIVGTVAGAIYSTIWC